jgi:hypothetical protein
MTGQTLPTVDMGGVNGGCEVFVRIDDKSSNIDEESNNTEGWVSCHVHFDSISPDSVSLLKADVGNVHVTMDRKIESDMRLLSASNAASVLVDTLLLDEDEDGEDSKELTDMLLRIDESSTKASAAAQQKMIKIRTKGFTEKASKNDLIFPLQNCEFVDGWIENRSAEPDSRFDRKVHGDVGSIGKIRLEGAANQALHGFQATDKDEKTSFPRPIIAISSTGEIVIETLSWLGNIARRYGLDEKREKEDLGRTATRRGRSLDPSNE